MDRFFHPRSLVVIGVSDQQSNIARFIVYNLLRWKYPGALYAVGPRGGSVYGLPIHQDLSSLPDGIDLAVILTPSRVVPAILESCGKKGIQRVVIESGGFGEYSDDARALEDRCLDIARQHGMRLVGPNGIGIVYPKHGVVLPFNPLDDALPAGDVSVLSQSGGVGVHLLLHLLHHGQPLSKMVSLGNKLDLDESDFVEYLLADSETRIIVLYLEGLSSPRRLMELASQAAKPIIVLKSNIGRLGAQAAQSHARALSADDAVVSAALRQAGMVRVADTEELTAAVKAFHLPPMKGNRVAVVSRSGGHGILVVDALERDGFELPAFPSSVIDETRKLLKADVIRLKNPLDVGDIFDFEAYIGILEAVLNAGEHDGIVFLHTYRDPSQQSVSLRIMEGVGRLSAQFDLPIACCLITMPEEVQAIRAMSTYPLFNTPEQAAHALAVSRDHWTHRPTPFISIPVAAEPNTSLLAEVRELRPGWLPMHESLTLLASLGIPTPAWGVASSADEAALIGERLGGPVVLKALSAQILHKTEVGAIELGLDGGPAIREGYLRLLSRIRESAPGAVLDGVLVQHEAPGGLELIVGGRRDATFGPIVVFGLGGIFAELFHDVAIRVAPFGRETASAMIAEIRGAKLLAGYRGAPAAEIEALESIILAVSELLIREPRIDQIDLNPIRVYPRGKGALALDVRICIGE